VIKKESLEFNNKTILITGLEVTKEKTFESFEYGFRMDPSPLNLSEEVTQIKVNYEGERMYLNYIYISGANSMIFPYKGVFIKPFAQSKNKGAICTERRDNKFHERA
jgi:hypothetical protein